jgi:RNA polymerase sigma factor (sigma-70 family)
VHPGVVLEQQERAKMLFAAIDRLPDSQKVAFTLQHLEGLPLAEVAEVMQTSVGAVESLLHRAKQKLRTYLNSYYQLNKDT